eukprot:TRINITY_DN643_c0_g1_i4.p1 TRINITY_DN643_c0_g1~~TRINITY_DN643_c0_g1_i4.p1  ORF type:complete len:713 (+),score=145.76 TRINITY_DN643_c0_g1_i4:39-2141(+)
MGDSSTSWIDIYDNKELPRLPVPELRDTIDQYLEILTPLLSQEELENTRRVVEDFYVKDGPELHNLLVKLQVQAKTSWLEGEKRTIMGDSSTSWIDIYDNKELPRLPVPELRDTIDQYLEILTPLLSQEELENTRRVVEDFYVKDGPELHNLLVKLQVQAKTSWLEGFWDSAYLEIRYPLPINVNPCFVFQDDPSPVRNDQVIRAAALTASSLWFIDNLRNGRLDFDRERTNNLCMFQYTKLFGSTRIPYRGRDKLLTFHESKHITILARNHFYSFVVFDEDGGPLSQEELELCYDFILKDVENNPDPDLQNYPISLLTTLPRDRWAKVYNKLMDFEINQVSFDKLASSLFVVCLDDSAPSGLESTSKVMLHSDGTNRWFDKSIQLIVCQNGKSGINMEHTGIDGHTSLRFATDIFNYSIRRRCDSPSPYRNRIENLQDSDKPFVERLNWELSVDLKKEIEKATLKYTQLVQTTDTKVLHFTAFGKRFIVRNKISPDALVQVAFQLAYYGAYNEIGSTYESAMTKSFFHGRTETMRSVTEEMMDFLRLCSDSSSTAKEQKSSLKKAAKAHIKRLKRAKQGMGIDRHLFGLYSLSLHQQQKFGGYQIPEIFLDPAYAKMKHDILSTSNCGGYALSLFGFGPVVPNGFGIGYIIKDSCMHFNVTSFNRVQTARLVNLLELSLLEIAQLLVNGTPIRLRRAKL